MWTTRTDFYVRPQHTFYVRIEVYTYRIFELKYRWQTKELLKSETKKLPPPPRMINGWGKVLNIHEELHEIGSICGDKHII